METDSNQRIPGQQVSSGQISLGSHLLPYYEYEDIR